MKRPDEVTGAPWLTTAAAADILGVTERTIQRRAAKSQMPSRKVTDEHGDRWLVQIAPVTNDTPDPTPTTSSARMSDEWIERKSGSLPTSPDTYDDLGATLTTSPDRPNDRLIEAALLAEKDGRIGDLQRQIDSLNRILEREQNAHAETRRVLAFNLSNAAALAGQARSSDGLTGYDSPATPTGPEIGAQSRGDGLSMLRKGLRAIFGAR